MQFEGFIAAFLVLNYDLLEALQSGIAVDLGATAMHSRIDFLLISPGLAREWVKEDTYIPFIPNWGVASDHRPIMATFEETDK